MKPRNLVVLGSTGSIGTQALEVVDKYRSTYNVIGVAAYNEVDMLLQQAARYNCNYICTGDENAYQEARDKAPRQVNVLSGIKGMCELASHDEADTVLVAVSGSVGILPTLAAARAGKRIALANKETLVAAGEIVMQEINQNNAELIPVDSEHSAVFQCLAGETKNLDRIWLTASGGPFRDYLPEEMQKVTPEMALRHPNWLMGPKITIDSATMMNKGLEVIEAHHLFNTDYERIKVVIQKESVIHSMVELVDGSFLAHMGAADMRIPIQYALSYPSRMESPAAKLNLADIGAIHFEVPDFNRFPALKLAYEAGKMGGTMPAVLNAANEAAVHSFLRTELGFTSIARVVEEVLCHHAVIAYPDLDTIMETDRWARDMAGKLIVKEANR